MSYSRHPNRPPGVCSGLPLDGTASATDWVEIHGRVLVPFDDLRQIENPACGWVQNSNNAPWYNSCDLTPADFQCPAGLCDPTAGGVTRGGRYQNALTFDKIPCVCDGTERLEAGAPSRGENFPQAA